VSSYSFTNVTANHTIVAAFTIIAVSEHVYMITIDEGWIYEPNGLRTNLEIEIETDTTINLVEFITPANHTFQIPKLPLQWSEGIGTDWYSDPISGTYFWEYWIDDFNDSPERQDYGDGFYTIKAFYDGGGQYQTNVWYGIPESNDPISQPIQEPNLIFPPHNGAAPSPVTFTWQPCTEANATSIWLHLEKEGTDNGLAGHWEFDDCNDPGRDSSGHNDTATLIGDPECTNEGMNFDGVDDYVDIADDPSLDMTTKLTVALWMKQPALAVNKALAAKWDYQTQGCWAFQTDNTNSDELMVFIATALGDNGSGGNGRTTGANMAAGSWYHVAFVYDGEGAANADRLRVYVDGQEKTLSFAGTIPSFLQNSSASVKIGKFGGILGRYFNGAMDDVRIYNRALNSDEIGEMAGIDSEGLEYELTDTNSAPVLLSEGIWEAKLCFDHLYDFNNVDGIPVAVRKYSESDCTFTVRPSDLAGHWEFDEGGGSIAADSSGYNNVGSLVNGPTWTVQGELSFDGVDDYLDIADDPSLDMTTKLTVALWMQQPELDTDKALAAKWDYQTQGCWAFQTANTNSDELMVFIATHLGDNGSGGRGKTRGVNMVAGSWYHVAFVYDGEGAANADRLKVYVDGQEKTLSFAGAIPSFLQNSSASVKIGKFGGIFGRYFNGLIDDVRVYNRALSTQEVGELVGTPPNAAPVLESIGNRTVKENEMLSINLNATDPDGDAITYSCPNPPVGATFSGDTFTWIPAVGQKGNYSATFIASDGQLEDSETITITVKKENGPPMIEATGDKSVSENSLLSFSISATDPDGDAITYSCPNLPAGATFSGDTFIWTPDVGQEGNYPVTFIASDGQLTDSETITITVTSASIIDGLVGYWQFDEGGGTIAADSSGYNNVGSLVNGPTWTVQGELSFDGVDDYVDIADDPSLDMTTKLTVALWMKQPVLATNKALVAKWNYRTQGSWAFQTANLTDSDELMVFTAISLSDNGSGGNAKTTGANIVAESWYHVAFVFDGDGASNADRLKVYVDGQEKTLSFAGTIPSFLQNSSASVKIGEFGGTLHRYFNGLIDDVRIYNRALSAEEMLELAVDPNHQSQLPPIANAGLDRTVIDADSNGFEQIDLDGSQSTDPDGTIASYVWTEDGNQLATGANPTVVLSVGEHPITLTVTDDINLTDTDTVTITVAGSGLVGHWQFDEGGGTIAADSSGYNNVGSLVNGPTWTVQGELSFDGIDDYVDIADDPSLDMTTKLTVALWMKQPVLATDKALAAKWDYRTQGCWAFQTANINSDELMVFTATSLSDNGSGGNGKTTGANMAAGSWYHVAFIYDGDGAANADRLKVYVDGQEKTLSFVGTIPSFLQNSSASVKIGKFGRILGRYFNGTMDDVRIYNRALGAGEILELAR
jgi:hypothetical protein